MSRIIFHFLIMFTTWHIKAFASDVGKGCYEIVKETDNQITAVISPSEVKEIVDLSIVKAISPEAQDSSIVDQAAPSAWKEVYLQLANTNYRSPLVGTLKFKDQPLLFNAFYASRYLQFFNSGCSRLLSTLNDWTQAKERKLFHMPYAQGFFNKAKALFQDFAFPLVRFSFPLVFDRYLVGPTDEIFRLQWKDARYVPSPKESDLLAKWGARELFDDKKEFMTKHPRWVVIRKLIQRSAKSAIATAYALTISMGLVELGSAKGIVSEQEFVSAPMHQLAEDEIAVLVQETPFPHTSVLINDVVFSYGVTHLTRTPVAQYFNQANIAGVLAPNQNAQADQDASSRKSSAGSMRFLGKHLPKSTHVIILKVTSAEKDSILRAYTQDLSKRYENCTHAYDCSTAAMEKLGYKNRLADASPSAMAGYFSVLKLKGDPRVKDMFFVASTDNQAKQYAQHALASWMSLMDMNVYVNAFLINQGRRAGVEIAYKPEEIQAYDPEIKILIEERKQSILRVIQMSEQIELFSLKAKFLSESGSKDEKDKLINEVEKFVGQTLQDFEDVKADPESELLLLFEKEFRWRNAAAFANEVQERYFKNK